ncbi:MAG TPA: MarR family winged helix-turn-helix transcriptional regulator [Acidimicrobiales bacterium]|nr:MarR family winged helix-turn-helix transcriptional regulator [Acidimicrobiales bacterium]
MSAPRARAEELRGDLITLVGLVLETATGLRRELGPALMSEIGVGGQSFEILVRLSRSPGARLRMSDLAAQTGLTPSGLTRALDRLIAAGLARREACPSDRRGAFAALTPSGRERMTATLDRHERDIAALLDGVLACDEAETLTALLRKVRDRVHDGALAGTLPCDEEGALPSLASASPQ